MAGTPGPKGQSSIAGAIAEPYQASEGTTTSVAFTNQVGEENYSSTAHQCLTLHQA